MVLEKLRELLIQDEREYIMSCQKLSTKEVLVRRRARQDYTGFGTFSERPVVGPSYGAFLCCGGFGRVEEGEQQLT